MPGFHYPSSRPEFTGRVDGPSTRPVNSGNGNRALVICIVSKAKFPNKLNTNDNFNLICRTMHMHDVIFLTTKYPQSQSLLPFSRAIYTEH